MLRRSIPTQRQLKTRKAILESYQDLHPIKSDYYGLERGNRKTGTNNSKGQTALVWNLPPVVTCPGATNCANYCYNADTRNDIFPIERWCSNLYWVRDRQEDAIKKINAQIRSVTQPVIRLHSSGDFFSNDYIEMWKKIATENREAIFWGYTRSWRIPELINSLEQLRLENNVWLYASLEENDIPPKGWAFCKVGTKEYHEGLFNCPEQYLGGPNCLSCGVCFSDDIKNIYFVMH